MNYLYNETVFWSFVGGAFSLVLTVVVLYIKQDQKRNEGRTLFEEKYRNNPEIGDIETKLDESLDYKKPDVPEFLAIWGLQPLYIIAVAGLIVHASRLEIVGVFLLSLIVFLHELVWERKHAKKWGYKLFIVALWIVFYFIITVKANEKESNIPSMPNNHEKERRTVDSTSK